jgi:hypothetical protein
MKRRAFLGTALAGLSLTGAFAAPPPTSKAWDIPTTILGKTGVRVQVIAQGGARMDLHPDMPSAAAELSELNAAVSAIEVHGARLPAGVLAMSGVEAPAKN